MTTTVVSPRAVLTRSRRLDWRILDDQDFETPQQGMARDAELGIEVANGGPPTFRLWENPQSLAVSRLDTRLPYFSYAAKSMAVAGWPVILRETGGSAVPLGQGVLNLSLVVPRSLLADQPGTAMELVYSLLCEPIRQTLATLNIKSRFGSVVGAFCDGRFNLVVDGRKIAGTAQAWRTVPAASGDGYILAQVALLVDVDANAFTAAANRFYQLAGRPVQFASTEIVSVRECVGRRDRPGTPTPGLVNRIRGTIFHHCECCDGEIRRNFS